MGTQVSAEVLCPLSAVVMVVALSAPHVPKQHPRPLWESVIGVPLGAKVSLLAVSTSQ